jgi:uncharacterized protein YjbJ (UPF0337 family)
MNDDKVKGQWQQWTSAYLEGKIQERYGIARDEAKRQMRDFSSRL